MVFEVKNRLRICKKHFIFDSVVLSISPPQYNAPFCPLRGIYFSKMAKITEFLSFCPLRRI